MKPKQSVNGAAYANDDKALTNAQEFYRKILLKEASKRQSVASSHANATTSKSPRVPPVQARDDAMEPPRSKSKSSATNSNTSSNDNASQEGSFKATITVQNDLVKRVSCQSETIATELCQVSDSKSGDIDPKYTLHGYVVP
jgi:hypothetical protein